MKSYAAKPPALLGSLPLPARNAEVCAALHRCLSPDPAVRLTALALRDILSGRGATAGAPMEGAREALVSDTVELRGVAGQLLQIGVRTEIGKALVRQFGPDGEFWDNRQCVVERNAARQWVVSPVEGTTNETLLNGQTLTAPSVLHQADVIAVGRQEKSVTKLPLTVRGR